MNDPDKPEKPDDDEEQKKQQRRAAMRERQRRIMEQMRGQQNTFKRARENDFKQTMPDKKTNKGCILESCERIVEEVEGQIRKYIGGYILREELNNFRNTVFLYIDDIQKENQDIVLKCYDKHQFYKYTANVNTSLYPWDDLDNRKVLKIPVGDYNICVVQPNLKYENIDITLYKLTRMSDEQLIPLRFNEIQDNYHRQIVEDEIESIKRSCVHYKIQLVDMNDIREYFKKCSDDEFKTNLIKNGIIVEPQENGNIFEFTYVNGVKEGLSKMIIKEQSGEIYKTIECYYKNNLKNGICKTTNHNGILIEEKTYVNDLLEGILKKYDVYGRMIAEEMYKDGLLNGPYFEIDDNIRTDGIMYNGQPKPGTFGYSIDLNNNTVTGIRKFTINQHNDYIIELDNEIVTMYAEVSFMLQLTTKHMKIFNDYFYMTVDSSGTILEYGLNNEKYPFFVVVYKSNQPDMSIKFHKNFYNIEKDSEQINFVSRDDFKPWKHERVDTYEVEYQKTYPYQLPRTKNIVKLITYKTNPSKIIKIDDDTEMKFGIDNNWEYKHRNYTYDSQRFNNLKNEYLQKFKYFLDKVYPHINNYTLVKEIMNNNPNL